MPRKPIPEQSIEQVVKEASQQVDDAQYITRRVDELIAAQPTIMQYVVAHKDAFSMEEIVQVLFHAALIHQSVASARGRAPKTVDFSDLNAAATTAPTLEALAEHEPSLASYIYSNVVAGAEGETSKLAGTILAHVGLALAD